MGDIIQGVDTMAYEQSQRSAGGVVAMDEQPGSSSTMHNQAVNPFSTSSPSSTHQQHSSFVAPSTGTSSSPAGIFGSAEPSSMHLSHQRVASFPSASSPHAHAHSTPTAPATPSANPSIYAHRQVNPVIPDTPLGDGVHEGDHYELLGNHLDPSLTVSHRVQPESPAPLSRHQIRGSVPSLTGRTVPTSSPALNQNQHPNLPSPFASASHSPWAHLAATSGAPTPSLEGPGGNGGSPFGWGPGVQGNHGFFVGGGLVPGSGSGSESFSPGGATMMRDGSQTRRASGSQSPSLMAGGARNGRGMSPHLGGPFELLNLGNGAGGGSGAQTPGIASASMADPFSFDSGSNVNQAASPPSGTTGASPSSPNPMMINSLEGLLARRRGSKSGPSGLKQSHVAAPSTAFSTSHTTDGVDTSSSTSILQSLPQGLSAPAVGSPYLPMGSVSGAGGMKLNLPSGLAARRSLMNSTTSSPSSSSSNLASTSSAGSSTIASLPSALTAKDLVDLLSDNHTLVLDLRPPSSYVHSHIQGSLSLPIPSTLLKRPGFSFDKVAEMLSVQSCEKLKKFRQKQNIVIVDQDSQSVVTGSTIAGMGNKILNAQPSGNAQEKSASSYHGKIWFVKGGIAACYGTQGLSIVDGDEGETQDDGGMNQEMTSNITAGNVVETEKEDVKSKIGGLKLGLGAKDGYGRIVGGLDKTAFQQVSVAGPSYKRLNALKLGSLGPGTPGTGNNRFDLKLSAMGGGSGNASPGSIASHAMSRNSSADSNRNGQSFGAPPDQSLQPANPFFDNIRQNLELSHGGITERIPLGLPAEVEARAHELPPFLRDLVEKSGEDAAGELAGEFESVERDEQKRLQGIMEWHSRGCRRLEDLQTSMDGDVDEHSKTLSQEEIINRKERKTRVFPVNLKRMNSHGEVATTGNISAWRAARQGSKDSIVQALQSPGGGQEYFPFSITAGVERGSKNRYKNIWPYDYSRVRLIEQSFNDGSDYVNANFVQPLGTTKRYIATQGPLESTFQDFWTLVWEQEVHVIVMLTKEFEGGSIKCGSYWTDKQYGPLTLELVSTEGEAEKPEGAVNGGGFGFGFPVASEPNENAPTIKRQFVLSHANHPKAGKRRVTQVQSVSWPDFDVPREPKTLLNLVKEVDQASDDMANQNGHAGSKKPPILVHCSAGVGRTGSYIVVDSVLEGLRREHSLHARVIRGSGSSVSRHRHTLSEVKSEGKLSPDPSIDTASPVSGGKSIHGKSKLEVVSRAPLSSSPGPMDVDMTKKVFDTTPEQSDRRSSDEFGEVHFPNPSHGVASSPISITDMRKPVKNVLEGMRVQRMSLCQTLRQYLFVYRAIIIGYLEMLDEEREALKQDITLRSPNHLLGLASTGSTDDEGHHKRRASPTDLGSGIRLQKRPSIKLKSKKKSQYGLHGHGKKISPTKDTFGHADPRTTSPSTGGDPYFAGPASFSSASNLSSSPSISAQPTSPMDMDTN